MSEIAGEPLSITDGAPTPPVVPEVDDAVPLLVLPVVPPFDAPVALLDPLTPAETVPPVVGVDELPPPKSALIQLNALPWYPVGVEVAICPCVCTMM